MSARKYPVMLTYYELVLVTRALVSELDRIPRPLYDDMDNLYERLVEVRRTAAGLERRP